MFDYRKLCFIQIIAYTNEDILYIIDNIFYFYSIKTFLSDNVINNIKIKVYIKMKIFICIKGRYINKGWNIIIIRKFDYKYLFNLIILYVIAINI